MTTLSAATTADIDHYRTVLAGAFDDQVLEWTREAERGNGFRAS